MVIDQPEVATRLRSAFPRTLSVDVEAALKVIPESQHRPSDHDIGPVAIGGEQLLIPCRIYSPEPNPNLVAVLSETQNRVLDSLYTRHHDGFVRERYLQRLLDAVDVWIPPFVLQLVGEYVVEIIQVIAARIPSLRNDRYFRFASENPAFISLTRQRVTSYWNCYYRFRYPRLSDYLGFKVMNALQCWEEP